MMNDELNQERRVLGVQTFRFGSV